MLQNVKTFIIAIMLLTFVGQTAMASMMPGNMEMSSSKMSSMDDHSNCQDMADDVQATIEPAASAHEDCKQDCKAKCPMASCSAMIINQIAFSAPTTLSISQALPPLTSKQKRFSSSLYRPPITC